jgi:hypothetical protein
MRRHCLYNRGQQLLLLHVLVCVICQKTVAESALAADSAVAAADDHVTHGDTRVLEVEDDNHQDQERDDRTWLDVFGQVAKEYLTTQLIPPTDASCVWDWRVARCEPFCQCAFLPVWGDYHLGRSCRYRPEAVCAPQEVLTFDQLRMEYETSPQLAHLGDIPPLKQILFRTVTTLQTTRDYVQKISSQLQSSTRKHYESLQENTCSHSCIPPSQWSLKQALLCQGWDILLCPEEQTEATDSDKNKLRLFKSITDSWKQLWNKLAHLHPAQDEDTVHDFSRQSGYNLHRASSSVVPASLSLPEWSTASDWSAGIVIPKQKPTRNYRQNSPRPHVTSGMNENSAVFDNNQEEPLAESQQQQPEVAPSDPSTEDSTDSQVEKSMTSQGDNYDDGVSGKD